MKTTSRLTLGSIALVAFFAACSDDMPPPAGDAVNGSDPWDGGGRGPAVTAEAGDDASEPDEPIGPTLCNDVEQRSEPVAEYETIFAFEAPKGGVIVPGVYVLNGVEERVTPGQGADPEAPPTRPTSVLRRVTIHVTSKTMRTIEETGTDDGNGGVFEPASVSAATYTVKGTTLERTPVCPTAGPAVTQPFTVEDNLLTLFESADRQEVFLRKMF